MKIKLNTLYRVKYSWSSGIKFGIGFAYEVNGKFVFAISLPNGGCMNVSEEDTLDILEIGVAMESDGCIIKY